ncbi:MAG: DUF4956 domain-containing protein [Hymenobacteraceae bacterium]|nr:DUF4956 domain-containing protein [Hymenobacteraceae bacterium]
MLPKFVVPFSVALLPYRVLSSFPALLPFLYKLLTAAGLAWLVAIFYVRFGGSLADRRALARQFLLLTLTTLLIIHVVKTSIALSLGLVGALSLIRFRTAIKEPEELGYLFLSVAIGLAVGAGYALLTAGGVLVVLALLGAQAMLSGRGRTRGGAQVFLTVSGPSALATELRRLTEAAFPAATLRRLDADATTATLAWLLPAPTDADTLLRTQAALVALDPAVQVSAVEQRELLY